MRRRTDTIVPMLPPAMLTVSEQRLPQAPECLPQHVIDGLSRARGHVREHRLIAAREAVEIALDAAPESFTVNAVHGEVLYRLGLYKEASSALFTAMVLPPTTWMNYQLVSHLYQESRARERGSFVRVTEAPPPKPIEMAIRWVAHQLRFMGRLRRLEATG
jgi:Tfp pilus assembly protein PilF